jgi:hypothetical protein
MQTQIAGANVVEIQAATSSNESITVSAGTDSGWVALTSGPQQTITTNSGKIVVTVAGQVKLPQANNNALGVISYELRNAAGVQVIAPDNLRGVAALYIGGIGSLAQAGYSYVHDGLTPGAYTIKTLYRFTDGAGGGGPFTANFINRALIAKGY